MKTLLGLLTALAAAAAILSGTAALGLLYGGGVVASWEAASSAPGFLGGLLIALLGFATIIGLVCAILSGLVGLLTTIANLLGGRWIAAAISGLVFISGTGLWLFFITRPAQ